MPSADTCEADRQTDRREQHRNSSKCAFRGEDRIHRARPAPSQQCTQDGAFLRSPRRTHRLRDLFRQREETVPTWADPM